MNTKHVNIFQAYHLFFQNYLNFKDNSSRTEYWWAFFCNWLIRIVLLMWILISYLKGQTGSVKTGLIILGIFCLIVLIPSISLTVRRYRNAGINVYWILFTYLLPYFLQIAIHEAAAKTIPQLVIQNCCAILEFICLLCAVILPLLPTKQD